MSNHAQISHVRTHLTNNIDKIPSDKRLSPIQRQDDGSEFFHDGGIVVELRMSLDRPTRTKTTTGIAILGDFQIDETRPSGDTVFNILQEAFCFFGR